jgi:probable selenium-dependent hydroxylase accessory protein YqeC
MPASPPADAPQAMGPLCDALGLHSPGIVAVAGSGGKTTLVQALAAELAARDQTVAISPTTHIYPPPARLCGPAWLWKDSTPSQDEIKARLGPGKVTAVAQRLTSQGKLKGLDQEQVASLAASGAWLLAEADGSARKPLKAWAPHEPVWPGREALRVVLIGARALGKPLMPELVHRHEEFAQAAGMGIGDRISPQNLAKVVLGSAGPFGEFPSGVNWCLVVNQVDAAPPELVESLIRVLYAEAGSWLRLYKGRVRWGGLEGVEPKNVLGREKPVA